MIMIMKKMMMVEKIIHANWDSAKFHGAADASALPSHLQSENFPPIISFQDNDDHNYKFIIIIKI